MTSIVYKGDADVRELASDDLKKAGVEGFKKTAFAKGVPTEVADDVATALIENDIFGDFGLSSDVEIVAEPAPSTKASTGFLATGSSTTSTPGVGSTKASK